MRKRKTPVAQDPRKNLCLFVPPTFHTLPPPMFQTSKPFQQDRVYVTLPSPSFAIFAADKSQITQIARNRKGPSPAASKVANLSAEGEPFEIGRRRSRCPFRGKNNGLGQFVFGRWCCALLHHRKQWNLLEIRVVRLKRAKRGRERRVQIINGGKMWITAYSCFHLHMLR